MNLDLTRAELVGLIVTFALPVLVGLVTTRVTSAGVKAVLLLALTAADGFLVEFANPGEGYSPANSLFYAGISFVMAVAAHFGLWKPTGVSGRAQDSLITSSGRPVSGV